MYCVRKMEAKLLLRKQEMDASFLVVQTIQIVILQPGNSMILKLEMHRLQRLRGKQKTSR